MCSDPHDGALSPREFGDYGCELRLVHLRLERRPEMNYKVALASCASGALAQCF